MISVILLASGYSSRFGGNKLLYPIGNTLMYRLAVEAAMSFQRRFTAEPVRLICVTAYEEIERELRERDGFEQWKGFGPDTLKDWQEEIGHCRTYEPQNLVVMNRNREKGISYSIALGLDAAKNRNTVKNAEEDSWMFLVCDQPWLSSEDLLNLAGGFRRSGKTIGCMSYEGQTGNPVIFSHIYREELYGLTGDTGGKAVVRRHPKEIYHCPATSALTLQDIDDRTLIT